MNGALIPGGLGLEGISGDRPAQVPAKALPWRGFTDQLREGSAYWQGRRINNPSTACSSVLSPSK